MGWYCWYGTVKAKNSMLTSFFSGRTMCTYDNLSPCIPLLKLNESCGACKMPEQHSQVNEDDEESGDSLKSRHGCLAALSGGRALLRVCTSVCSSDVA